MNFIRMPSTSFIVAFLLLNIVKINHNIVKIAHANTNQLDGNEFLFLKQLVIFIFMELDPICLQDFRKCLKFNPVTPNNNRISAHVMVYL